MEESSKLVNPPRGDSCELVNVRGDISNLPSAPVTRDSPATVTRDNLGCAEGGAPSGCKVSFKTKLSSIH